MRELPKGQLARADPKQHSQQECHTCRTKADAPEIDGNLFIDERFEGLAPGDIVAVTVEEAGEYDLWGRLV